MEYFVCPCQKCESDYVWRFGCIHPSCVSWICYKLIFLVWTMIIKRGSRDTRSCLPVNESIKKPVTCQEDYAKVKKGKTQEVHKDETSWDAFVKSFKD